MEETHMADLPPSPDTDDETRVGPDRKSTGGTTRWQKVVGIIGLVVALWVGSEMYDTVFPRGPGPGGPGPGQHAPGENQEQEIDTGDDGGHDPSQFEH